MLQDLLQFWTGFPQLPRDTSCKLIVKYCPQEPTKVLAVGLLALFIFLCNLFFTLYYVRSSVCQAPSELKHDTCSFGGSSCITSI